MLRISPFTALLCLSLTAPLCAIETPDNFSRLEGPRRLTPTEQDAPDIQRLLQDVISREDTIRHLTALGYRLIESWSHEASILRAIQASPEQQEATIMRLPYHLCPEQNKYAFLSFDLETRRLASYHICILNKPLPFDSEQPLPERLKPLWTKDELLLGMTGRPWSKAISELEEHGYKYCREQNIIEAARQLALHSRNLEIIKPPLIRFGYQVYIVVLLNTDGTISHHEITTLETEG